MNKVILIGRTTKDIELKHTQSGKEVVSFTVAVNRPFKNANGEYDSDFINCVAFGKLAEIISRNVYKGDRIGIDGRLQSRTYTDGNGNNRYVTEMIVENIEFLQPKKQEPINNEPVNEYPQEPVNEYPVEEFEEIDPFGDLPF